ncbi:MAG TPA: DUF6306 domain-containing protein [Burkholderiales bacterium]|nr:DUF6306 domain-containing protein [Burkholderiales bacterium]
MRREEIAALLNELLEAERATSGWAERLALLDRSQAWVVRRVSAALPRLAGSPAREVLARMRDEHRDNIAACEALLAELAPRSAVT